VDSVVSLLSVGSAVLSEVSGAAVDSEVVSSEVLLSVGSAVLEEVSGSAVDSELVSSEVLLSVGSSVLEESGSAVVSVVGGDCVVSGSVGTGDFPLIQLCISSYVLDVFST